MNIAVVTGSSGLVGSTAVRFLNTKDFDLIVGIDNDKRAKFFGSVASTNKVNQWLKSNISSYHYFNSDICDQLALSTIFATYKSDIKLIIHAAAQPSHDYSALNPLLDFKINALGTLQLLETTKYYCPNAVFIFCSTNKVYGDQINQLNFYEASSRYMPKNDTYRYYGIDESLTIDNTLHSPFGVSKASADLMVQEYARYFGLITGIFRGGCLTGPNHASVELHGFLSYLMKCAVYKKSYTIYGYQGKQVRDNIHVDDLLEAFWEFYNNPQAGQVYNIGGSTYANCSIIEAIRICERLTHNKMNIKYTNKHRLGDHLWWISDTRKFKSHYPHWKQRYNIIDILTSIYLNLTTENI